MKNIFQRKRERIKKEVLSTVTIYFFFFRVLCFFFGKSAFSRSSRPAKPSQSVDEKK